MSRWMLKSMSSTLAEAFWFLYVSQRHRVETSAEWFVLYGSGPSLVGKRELM